MIFCSWIRKATFDIVNKKIADIIATKNPREYCSLEYVNSQSIVMENEKVGSSMWDRVGKGVFILLRRKKWNHCLHLICYCKSIIN